MGRIVLLDNPLDPGQRREYVHRGPLIDWLQERYPTGFGRPHVTAFNAQRLAVADYDREVGPGDVVVIGLVPAWEMVVTAIIGALISTAISYIANSIFGPAKGSKNAGKSLPDPSPTYSLSVPTNMARLGQPIPVIYGRVIATPDLASTPYSWYENNEMYVGMLLCLGQGWHTVEELRVADTPVQQLAAGTVSYRVFAPDEHAQTFGAIQTAMGPGFYENVYTSPEVADQELDAERTGGGGTGGASCHWVYTNRLDCANNRIVIDAAPDDWRCGQILPIDPANALPDGIAIGQSLILSNAGVNNGTFSITAFEEHAEGAWLEVSPALTCPAGKQDFTVPGARFVPTGPFGLQITWLEVLLYECWQGGTYLGNDCDPLYPIDEADIGATLTLSWQEDGALPGQTYTFTATGTLTAVARVPGLPSYLNLSLNLINFTADPPGAAPGWCTNLDPPDCDVVGPVSVLLMPAADEPQIAWEAGSEAATLDCGAGSIGPFVACNPGWTTSKLQLDIVFPYGLYKANNDGGLAEESVSLLFTAYQIDDDALAIGASYERLETFTAASNTPQRHTLTWDLPQARYSVCARRTTAKSDRAVDMSNALWTGLKAILDSKGQAVYDRTTLIAVKAKATNGLASDALNRFTLSCIRTLPDYTQADPDANRADTSSHVQAAYDIYTNAWYGAQRPRAEVEIADFDTVEQRVYCRNGFNAIFDSQVSVWEAMSLSVAAISAFPATSGAQLTLVEDIARATSSHCFNASNVVQDSLQLSYKFNDLGSPDGIEVEYRNPETFQQAFELYPDASLSPEKLTLFGCTNQLEARRYAQRQWRQRLYRREFVSFQTELEGHLPSIGGLITLDHPLLAAPACYIVGAITPEDETRVRLEGHRYVPAVYRERPIVTPGDPDPEPLLVEINAKSQGVASLSDIAGGYARGVTLTGYYPTDRIRLSLPAGQTFSAWSPGGRPAYDPSSSEGSGSLNAFQVLAGANAVAFTPIGTNGGLGSGGQYWDGYAAARAGFVAVELTGYHQYTFVLYDPDGAWTSNTGGLSIQVEIVY